ncbi:MAG: uroporphyrinogen-III C-methyltransferase [Proteobacteria bacterium]|nr:uroporphyrinogen-III C-methyltransferase [Pseudomonadota bacterium]
MKKGFVSLVGAGPGDPLLITIKGKICIENADVVIYDYLANKELLKYAKKDCELIYVGKKSKEHTVDQDNINRLISEKAKEGKKVVRLKGGDPFIFGRGGEEALYLREHNIDFEIVPGITSGIAGPLYAGIPVTMRGVNSSVAFVTGHESEDKELSLLDWKSLTKMGTLIFYMGVKNLPAIVENLIKEGMDKETPVALIRWATYPEQTVLEGTLCNIVELVRKTGFKAPAVIIVGEVVKLRDKLKWFESKPLFGKKIIVTRASEQAGSFSSKLRDLGARVFEIPTIKIVPINDYGLIDSAIENIKNYDYLILTSVNGVKYFFERLEKKGRDGRTLSNLKICAIGPATAKAIKERFLNVDIMPEKYIAESVVESLEKSGIGGKKFLLCRAKIARDVIPDEIRKKGGEIDVIPVYETLINKEVKDELLDVLRKGVDYITFTSSSTVSNFFELIEENKNLLSNIKLASIGPVTSSTIKKLGFEPYVSAEEYTIDGLISAIIKAEGKN